MCSLDILISHLLSGGFLPRTSNDLSVINGNGSEALYYAGILSLAWSSKALWHSPLAEKSWEMGSLLLYKLILLGLSAISIGRCGYSQLAW